jgi:predicted O-methyltransferase YrrM
VAGKPFQIKSYLNYWLDAVDQHSLHSPFFFDFYTAVLYGNSPEFSAIESLREKLLSDHRTIVVEDMGTKGHLNSVRMISEIAASSLSTPRFSSLFHRIIKRYDHKTVIELGTSLGINTLYLADKKDAKVVTFEGSSEIAALAELTFEFGGAKNIRLIQGNIDATFPEFLLGVRKVDFVLIDANHTYEATMRYFTNVLGKMHEKSVMAIDDIHASPGMEKAWKQIIDHKLVHSSADAFRCGFLFFDPSLNKQHVILQF